MFSAEIDNTDQRLSKRADNGSARTNRVSSDRPISESRENTDSMRAEEWKAMLRNTDTLLPPPPKVDGFHSFWATTTNSKDSVEQRQRMGYQFITRSEAPNYGFDTQKSGEATDDRIMINEMVAMKIPQDLWEKHMMYKHYELPTESITDLKNSVRMGQDGRGRSVAYTGGEFQNGVADGFASLGKMGVPTLNGVR